MQKIRDSLDQNTSLQRYLATYKLDSLKVALTCKIRYLTIYNILHNKPVTHEYAEEVRHGLKQLTGVAYMGPIAQHTGGEPS